MPRNSPIRKPQSSHLLIRWSRPRAWRSKAPKVRGQTMLLHQLPGCVPRTKSFSWIRVVPLTHQLKLPKTVILQTLSSRQHCHPEHIRCTQCKLREGSVATGREILSAAKDDSDVPDCRTRLQLIRIGVSLKTSFTLVAEGGETLGFEYIIMSPQLHWRI